MTRRTAPRRGPILVTGAHRSGTTWVGRMLSIAPRTRMIHEPFNLQLESSVRFFRPGIWFLSIDAADAAGHRAAIAGVLGGFGYHRDMSKDPIRGPASLLRHARRRGAFLFRRLRGDRIIFKDPIAFFSAEWLASEFAMTPVVMIRHPAAFASSLKLKGWTFDFRNFLDQPRLMETRLAPWRDDIARAVADPPDIIGQGILLWNCIYGTALRYREEHPDWLFVTHESLSMDPVEGFRSLFAALGLEFGPAQARRIEEASGRHNPAEQSEDEFRRDARANIDNWKRRLSTEEIDRIFAGTGKIRPRFYDE